MSMSNIVMNIANEQMHVECLCVYVCASDAHPAQHKFTQLGN